MAVPAAHARFCAVVAVCLLLPLAARGDVAPRQELAQSQDVVDGKNHPEQQHDCSLCSASEAEWAPECDMCIRITLAASHRLNFQDSGNAEEREGALQDDEEQARVAPFSSILELPSTDNEVVDLRPNATDVRADDDVSTPIFNSTSPDLGLAEDLVDRFSAIDVSLHNDTRTSMIDNTIDKNDTSIVDIDVINDAYAAPPSAVADKPMLDGPRCQRPGSEAFDSKSDSSEDSSASDSSAKQSSGDSSSLPSGSWMELCGPSASMPGPTPMTEDSSDDVSDEDSSSKQVEGDLTDSSSKETAKDLEGPPQRDNEKDKPSVDGPGQLECKPQLDEKPDIDRNPDVDDRYWAIGRERIKQAERNAKKTKLLLLGDSIIHHLSARKSCIDSLYEPFRKQGLNLAMSSIKTGFLAAITDIVFGTTQMSPDVVWLAVGVNDCIRRKSTRNAVRNIKNTIRTIKYHSPRTKVIVQKILPTATKDPSMNGRKRSFVGKKWEDMKLHKCVETVNSEVGVFVKSFNQSCGLSFVDLDRVVLDPQGRFKPNALPDGLHLRGDGGNLSGYCRQIARALSSAV